MIEKYLRENIDLFLDKANRRASYDDDFESEQHVKEFYKYNKYCII
jgi:hypothetical protein